MRCRVLVVAVSLCFACSTAPATRASAPAPPSGPKTAKKAAYREPDAAQAAAPRAPLTRQFTGQPQPSLIVENRVGARQYVFIDWTPQGELAAGASQRFELDPGTHTITCSDSANPDDNPASVTETFETGFSYAYGIGQP